MFLRILDRIEEVLIAFLIGAATLIIFVSVMHRYLVGYEIFYPYLFPINMSWAQELCIYMFVWMAKFGAAYGVRTGIHVGVDLLVNKLSPSRRKATIIFGLLCGAFFTFVVGSMGAKFVYGLYFTDQVTADMELPSWMIYLCLPLGSYLMCFRFLQVALNFWQHGELPRHDETDIDGIDAEQAEAEAARIIR